MSITIIARGNLGTEPVLSYVDVESERKPVAEMRIRLDRRVPQDDGRFADKGGFWVTASLWGQRAEHAAKLLPKGARVLVHGTLRENSWEDQDGEAHSTMRLDLQSIGLDIIGVESCQFRRRENTDDEVSNGDLFEDSGVVAEDIT